MYSNTIKEEKMGTDKMVLDIGNCDIDHPRIREIIEANFSCIVDRAKTQDEADRFLASDMQYKLILINRVGAFDGKEAFPYIKKIKGIKRYQSIPVMLISNYEEAQIQAEQLGAVKGFGKDILGSPKLLEILHIYLVS